MEKNNGRTWRRQSEGHAPAGEQRESPTAAEEFDGARDNRIVACHTLPHFSAFMIHEWMHRIETTERCLLPQSFVTCCLIDRSRAKKSIPLHHTLRLPNEPTPLAPFPLLEYRDVETTARE